MREIHYKIRRISDGLFSTGGMQPYFTNKGKVWKKESHLKSHLNQLRQPYKGCELVIQEIIISELRTAGLESLFEVVQSQKRERRLKN